MSACVTNPGPGFFFFAQLRSMEQETRFKQESVTKVCHVSGQVKHLKS